MRESVLKLRSGRNGILRPAHPWIYKGQLLRPVLPIKGGSIVSVWTPDNKFVGRGYYNPTSDITVRLLTFKDEPLDGEFIDQKIKEAIARRASMAQKTNAYRVVFSEADSLPGLIIDLYGDTAVFQILTLGMERFTEAVVGAIRKNTAARYIYEKSDGPFRRQEALKVVKSWHGDKGNRYIQISEGKARFSIDIYEGHKTGFYLDQRSSRLAMHTVSKGKTVLDLFSYIGAFAIHAALSSAVGVTAVDIKEDWLALGRKNAALNNVSDRIEFVKADAFKYLDAAVSSGKKFDVIIVDPPSFLKTRRLLESASRGYKELNCKAMKCLNEDGVLATFSCSHNMPNAVFSAALKEAAARAGRELTILKRCRQGEDHPISRWIPETEYLKGYFFRVS
ncbi:MAG: class I SAM-dependent rRNA methyltransferase [Candidatus Omnitrophica bacterium]|nr:class I SAM-dependent rRNA methyltransferase [Candidatus Omnitrophota bacterium]